MATMSPCPFLVNYTIGGIIIITFWILVTSIFIRIRWCVATKLQECGQNILFVFGLLTIIGQIVGGVLAFVIVDVYRVFLELSPCQKASDICGF